MIKMSTRDKKLLISFIGILCLVASFLFIYRPFMEQVTTLKAQNEEKEKELTRLKELESKKDYFLSEIQVFNTKAEEYQSKFPVKVLEEDGILVARGIEKKLETTIASVMISESEFVYSPEVPKVEEVEKDDSTWAEKNAQATKDQIDKIEEELDGGSSNTQTTIQTAERGLFRMQNSIEFTTDYAGLKEVIGYIYTLPSRVTIDTINLTYDKTEGKLVGDAILNMYTLQEKDKEYETPNTENIKHGVDNIFGTLEVGTNNSENNND